ncbi:MAG: tetratricopeptide repeat protein, partial [Caldilineaceae bacterium]
QGLVYRRLGKLYEEQNQQQALTYYQMALERLPADHAETPVLLKDRAWVYVVRREYEAAEADLLRALDWQALQQEPADVSRLDAEAVAVRADILDVFSSLRRSQGENVQAIEHAQAALGLREQLGDLMRVGKSFITLGILYRMMGETEHAIGAYREAQAIFQRLDNPALAATALLNIGTAHHFAEQLAEAEHYYRRSLALADEVGLPLTEVRAHANLVEALADQGRDDEALGHWRAGYELSVESGFDDEVVYLNELLARYPALEAKVGAERSAVEEATQTAAEVVEAAVRDAEGTSGALAGGPAAMGTAQNPASPAVALDADEEVALKVAQKQGRLNAALLMSSAHVSKATATRKLARLAEVGLLERHGSGRGTYYVARRTPVVAAQPPVDRSALQARLDALTPRYSHSHAVERLEVRAAYAPLASQAPSRGEGEEAPALRFDVRVVFRRLPDLPAFFELEAALSDATRTRLRLSL